MSEPDTWMRQGAEIRDQLGRRILWGGWGSKRGASQLVSNEEQEANLAKVAAVPELLDVLDEFCNALDLSDPDHESFADSCADVVESLWVMGSKARALKARLNP